MILLLALAAVLSAPAAAQTEVRLSVGSAAAESAPVLALPAFTAVDPRKGEDALLAKSLREIVRSDLMLSRRFDVRDEEPGAAPAPGAAWRLKAAAAREGGKITVQVRLENAAGGESVFERFYRQDAAWLRPLAHRISDDVVKAATGRDGIARTRIAFVNNQTGHKELYVMDYDGASPKRLTDDRSIDLLQRF